MNINFIMMNFFIYVLLIGKIFLIFLLSLIFTICFVYLLNIPFNPPKAHAFVEKELKSAIGDIAIATAALSPLIFNIILNSAYLFAAGMYLSIFSLAIGQVSIPVLIGIMNFIIQYTVDMNEQALEYINNPSISLATLREVHAYLTPYIRSYESIFRFIRRIVAYLENRDSDFFPRVEGLEIEFRHAGDRLLEIYRIIERELSISVYESPISIQDSEL